MAWILQSIQRDEKQPQSFVEHLCIDYLHWERSHFGGLETKRRIPERKKWFQEEGGDLDISKVGFLTGEKNLKVGKDLKVREVHGDKCWGCPGTLMCNSRDTLV